MNVVIQFLTACAVALPVAAAVHPPQWFAVDVDCARLPASGSLSVHDGSALDDVDRICRGKVTHLFLRVDPEKTLNGGMNRLRWQISRCRERGGEAWVLIRTPGAKDLCLPLVKEIVSRCPADGVVFDWIGDCWHGGDRMSADLSDGFMRTAAGFVRSGGGKIAVRVPCDPDVCSEFGLGIVKWSREKLVDVVIPAPFAKASSDLPVEDWREMLKGTKVFLVPDLGRELPPAEEAYVPVFYRGIAKSFVERGADGVLLRDPDNEANAAEIYERGIFPEKDMDYDCPVSMHDWPCAEMRDDAGRDAAFAARRGEYLALLRRIDETSAAGGGRVEVDGTVWCDGPVTLKSGVEMHFRDGAKLVFTDNPDRYPPVLSSWEGVECINHSPLIYAYGQTNVAITGHGTLAPRMERWKEWIPRNPGHMAATRKLYDWCSVGEPVENRDLTKVPGANARPQLVQFNRCANVRLDGFRVRQSPFWVLHLFLCRNVHVKDVDVVALGNNTDGIDIEMTHDVLVEGCTFREGDDAIVIKAGRNRDGWRLATPSENIEIRNCTVRRGNSAFGIGSEVSGGVRNVWIHDCAFDGFGGTLLQIKTNERRGGFIENVRLERIEARGRLLGPAFGVDMDAMYQWREFPTREVRVTDISGICLRDISVERAERRMSIREDERRPVCDVVVENVAVKSTKFPDRREFIGQRRSATSAAE